MQICSCTLSGTTHCLNCPNRNIKMLPSATDLLLLELLQEKKKTKSIRTWTTTSQ